jgi:hypothetical protein
METGVLSRLLRFVLSSFVLGVLPPMAGAADTGQPVERAADYSRETLSGALRDSQKTTFELKVACPVQPEQSTSDSGRPPGVHKKTGCLVSELELTLNSRSVTIPPPALSGLSDAAIPLGVYLSTQGQEVVVHLKGGDGEGAYEARLFVADGRVVRREVHTYDKDGNPNVATQAF